MLTAATPPQVLLTSKYPEFECVCVHFVAVSCPLLRDGSPPVVWWLPALPWLRAGQGFTTD